VASEPCLYFLLESNALRFTTSSQAGVIVAAAPLLVALGARLFWGERMGRAMVAGLLLAIAGGAGLTLLGGSPGAGAKAANAPLGNAMEMGAMITAASYTLASNRLGRRYSPWSLTALQLAGGALCFLPGRVLLVRSGWAGFPWAKPGLLDGAKPGLLTGAAAGLLAGAVPVSPWTLVGVLAFLGSFVTLVAFGCYNWGLSRLPAARASLFLTLIPVVAVLLGWRLLGESLSVAQSVSAGAVIAGVFLGQRRGRR